MFLEISFTALNNIVQMMHAPKNWTEILIYLNNEFTWKIVKLVKFKSIGLPQ